ncbi:MAG: zinc permease, partial [Actinomycetia bacterium]|nr:zinc permease [Actinomycetes bacterium]
AGGPTFVGTIVGQAWVNEWLFLSFLGLAAGSILYVVIELLGIGRKLGYKELATWGILAGLFLGFATDMVLVAAGT